MTEPRPLKVLARVNELGLGGTQLNAVDFAERARGHGVDTTIVGYRETLPGAGPSLLDVAADRDVRIEVLDQGERGGHRDRRRRARELADLADRLDVDLVHAYGAWSARQAYWGPCRWGRRPLVITVYEMYVPDTVYRKPPLIVGTRYLLEEFEHTRGNTWLISPPVDLDHDAPGVAPPSSIPVLDDPDRLRIVIVSRLHDHMKAFGIGVAIRAMEQLDRDDVDLVIVGDGPAEDRLRAEADGVNARLGRRTVHLVGAMADPRPAYDAADVVLGMGGSAARTLAFGRPLVVIGEQGFCRTFRPETSDYLYRQSFWSDDVVPDAERRLLAELEPLLADADERERLGGFGRTFAETNFGLDLMTERQVAIYHEAMATYGRVEWVVDLGTEVVNAGRAAAWKLRRS